MNISELEKILQSASGLNPSERLLLASRLIQSVRNEISSQKREVKWKDVEGLIKYPALGEDAQKYISRKRTENDQHRQRTIRDGE